MIFPTQGPSLLAAIPRLKYIGICLIFLTACRPVETDLGPSWCFASVSPAVPSVYKYAMKPGVDAVYEQLRSDYSSGSDKLDYIPINAGVIYLSADCLYIDDLRERHTGVVFNQIDESEYHVQLDRSAERIQVFDLR